MPKSFRRSKYGAIKKVVDGITFASTGEANRYSELKLLEKAGEISSLRLQVRYPLLVNGQLVTTYIADFVYFDKRLCEITEDFKGIRTSEFVMKKKLMRAIHGIEIYETGTSKRLTRKRTQTKAKSLTANQKRKARV